MIYDITEYIEGKVPRGSPVRCPFHNDTHASAVVLPDSGVFWCFRCGIRADQREAAKRLWFPDLSWAQGLALATALLNEHQYPIVTEQFHAQTQSIPQPVDDPRIWMVLTAFCRTAGQHLLTFPHLIAELSETRAIINPVKLGLGYANYALYYKFQQQMLEEWPNWEQDGEDLMIRCGIVQRPGEVLKSADQRYRLHDRWIIPEIRTDEPRGRRVIYYQARTRAQQHRYRYLNPVLPRPIFGLESLDRDTDFVWLVEGPFDMLPLVEAGQSAVSCTGLSFNERVLDEMIPRVGDRRIAVVFDNDPPDEHGHSPGIAEGARRTTKLQAAGLDAVQVVPPAPHKDVGEWIVAVGVERVIRDVSWEL